MTILTVLVVLAAGLEATARARAEPHAWAPDQRVARLAIVHRFGHSSPAAVSVAYCESRLHPSAIGGNNVGLFQINYRAHHLAGEQWPAFVARFSDLHRNVEFAWRLSAGGTDWSAWTCQP